MVHILPGDRITLISFSCVAVNLYFYIQVNTKRGIKYFRGNFTTNATGAFQTQDFSSDLEGEVTDAFVSVSAAVVLRGDVYSSLILVNGEGVAGPIVNQMILCQGYVHNGGALSLGKNEAMGEGKGSLNYLTQANPAAGANFTITVPTNQKWRLKSLYFSFTTAAGGGARTGLVHIDNGVLGAPGHYSFLSPITQAAGLTYTYSFLPNRDTSAVLLSTDGVYIYLPPDMDMRSTYRVISNILAIAAGDQIINIRYVIERWMVQYV